MCWHICNYCNEKAYKVYGHMTKSSHVPCIWFTPGMDGSGLQGCPYCTPDDDDDEKLKLDPARWIAVTFSDIQELMKARPDVYKRASDKALDTDTYEYNKGKIEEIISI